MYRSDCHKAYYISCIINNIPFKTIRHIPVYIIIEMKKYDVFLKWYESFLLFFLSIITYFAVIKIVRFIVYIVFIFIFVSLMSNFKAILKSIRWYHIPLFFYLPIRFKLSLYSHWNIFLFPNKIGYIRYMRRNFRYVFLKVNKAVIIYVSKNFLLNLLESLENDYFVFRIMYFINNKDLKIIISKYFHFSI